MRIKRFDITAECLRSLFCVGRKDYEVEKNALPKDAELVRIHINHNESTPRTISLYFTSAEFPDLPAGTHLESTVIWLRKYYHDFKYAPIHVTDELIEDYKVMGVDISD